MLKKCKVAMLPTNKKASIGDYSISKVNEEINQKLFYGKIIQEPYNCSVTNYHLYILSDEEIKEEDWSYSPKGTPSIQRIDRQVCQDRRDYGWRKIIATTDSSLTPLVDILDSNGESKAEVQLPTLSQGFIEKFISEYNKGNIIQEVMVEYNVDYSNFTDWKEDEKGTYVEHLTNLKINPKDNTITIKKVKESWNREEVKYLLSRFSNWLDINYEERKVEIKQFINENL